MVKVNRSEHLGEWPTTTTMVGRSVGWRLSYREGVELAILRNESENERGERGREKVGLWEPS